MLQSQALEENTNKATELTAKANTRLEAQIDDVQRLLAETKNIQIRHVQTFACNISSNNACAISPKSPISGHWMTLGRRNRRWNASSRQKRKSG